MAHVYLNGLLLAHGVNRDYTLDVHGRPVFNFALRSRDIIILHRFEGDKLKKVERYTYDGEQLVLVAEDPPTERPPARTAWERVSEDDT